MSNLNGFVNAAFTELAKGLMPGLVAIQTSQRGAGAGVIWDCSGLIITNNHVLGRENPMVTLWDDRQVEARVLGNDTEIDLAILQIDQDDLHPMLIGDSTDMRVGEMVFALGHPWGQRASLSAGVISHLTNAQTRGPRALIPIIRTDARLAPGNSGGPLINGSGQVIGINTMIVGGDQGVAIPSSVVKEFVNSINISSNVPQTTNREPLI